MDPNAQPAPIRGIAAAAFALGFFSMVVFWWFPFGLTLGTVGFILALICVIFGVRGGADGERISLGAAALCVTSVSMILGIIRVMYELMGSTHS